MSFWNRKPRPSVYVRQEEATRKRLREAMSNEARWLWIRDNLDRVAEVQDAAYDWWVRGSIDMPTALDFAVNDLKARDQCGR